MNLVENMLNAMKESNSKKIKTESKKVVRESGFDTDHIKFDDHGNYYIKGLSTNALSYIRSILGQLSDGYWENSLAMECYWPFASIVGSDLLIKNTVPNFSNRRNKFAEMSESHIKQWFADKIRRLAKEESGEWSRSSQTPLKWLRGTVSGARQAYDELKGQSTRKNDLESVGKDRSKKVVKEDVSQDIIKILNNTFNYYDSVSKIENGYVTIHTDETPDRSESEKVLDKNDLEDIFREYYDLEEFPGGFSFDNGSVMVYRDGQIEIKDIPLSLREELQSKSKWVSKGKSKKVVKESSFDFDETSEEDQRLFDWFGQVLAPVIEDDLKINLDPANTRLNGEINILMDQVIDLVIQMYKMQEALGKTESVKKVVKEKYGWDEPGVGDKIEVTSGEYKGQKGEIISAHKLRTGNYSLSVKFADGRVEDFSTDDADIRYLSESKKSSKK